MSREMVPNKGDSIISIYADMLNVDGPVSVGPHSSGGLLVVFCSRDSLLVDFDYH